MSTQTIALMALLILSALGFLLVLIAVIIKTYTKKKNKRCTSETYGKVIKYLFPGDGRIVPVVEFETNQKKYVSKKMINGYIKVRKPSLSDPYAWEDEKGFLHTTVGPIANVKQAAQELWPIGAEMKVYFDSIDPRINYVERPTENSLAFFIFLITGIALIALGVLMYWLIQ